MREETVKVFRFEELNEEAKEVARNWWREVDAFDSGELLKEIFEAELTEYGLPTDDIEFSLGYCKGDGVAFYGPWEDLEQHLFTKGWISGMSKEGQEIIEYLVNNYDIEAVIERNSFGYRYSHYGTMDVEVLTSFEIKSIAEDMLEDEDINEDNHTQDEYEKILNEYTDKIYDAMQELEEVLQSTVELISKNLESLGYDEIEYRESEEVVDELLTVNEYEFTEEGKLWA